MIVPKFWSEARVEDKIDGRRLVVRRFGWSDESEADAERDAVRRVADAVQRLKSGEYLPLRERKVPYNGADGVPIREEVVESCGTSVITRNSYGARCLNTPNVVFVDVDLRTSPPLRLSVAVFFSLCATALLVGILRGSWLIGLATFFLGAILTSPVTRRLDRFMTGFRGGVEKITRDRIADFSTTHPDWHLRLYRTFAGFRVLVMHRTFEPTDPDVHACFEALGTDPVYARMCRVQKCFRARLSAKPWRIGQRTHLKPRPGVWPISRDRLPERARWIDEYEAKARDFAACRFVESLGSTTVAIETEDVRRLHDELCRATSTLPLA